MWRASGEFPALAVILVSITIASFVLTILMSVRNVRMGMELMPLSVQDVTIKNAFIALSTVMFAHSV